MKKHNFRISAFTLAEVLITLGVIGVIAAITIPTIIKSYQKKVTVTKLKKAMSIISQAYKLSYNEFGEISDEDANSITADDYFQKYWKPYIKEAVYCNTAIECGYKFDSFAYRNGDLNTAIISKSTRYTFYTPDGFVYIIRLKGGTPIKISKLIFVDINGGKGPNTEGKDVFMFVRDNGIIRANGYNKTTSQINNNCKKDNTGDYCAAKIIKDGWKISDDYPW